MRNYLVIKDKAKREKLKKIDKDCVFYKSVINNRFMEKDVREEAFFNLFKLTYKCYVSQVKNRCNITGRGRAINSSLRLSNYTLKILVMLKKIKGYIKGSW